MDKLIGIVIIIIIGLALIATGASMLVQNLNIGVGLISAGLLVIGFGFRIII
jgi:hypothetical protein